MSTAKLIAGHAVRRLRRQQGLSQAAMAEMLDISPSYLNLIERNQRPVSAALLVRLVETFDFDPRALTADAPGAARQRCGGGWPIRCSPIWRSTVPSWRNGWPQHPAG